MENNKLNIAWCYPDMLSLHGDRGNIMALKKVGELLDLDVNINKIETYKTEINFDETDIMFFNVGEVKLVETLKNVFEPQLDKLRDYIEKGKMIIAIGTTGAVFGKSLKRADGTEIKGLGFLNMNCFERDMIYGDDIIFELKDDESIKIAGNQIQIIDTKLEDDDIALGIVIYGYGNEGFEKKLEGAKYKNVIFTNALGPVLVKNPWYAEKLIKEAMKTKGVTIDKKIDESEYEIERNSYECVKKYNELKVDMK